MSDTSSAPFATAEQPPSVFARIISGDLPGHFVWRDPEVVAIMTIAPVTPGHVLVISAEQVDHWLDLEPGVWQRMNAVAVAIGTAQMAEFQPTRIGSIIAGLEVPHCHIHLVPIDSESDLSFANADPTVAADELADQAARLRTRLSEAGYSEASNS